MQGVPVNMPSPCKEQNISLTFNNVLLLFIFDIYLNKRQDIKAYLLMAW